MPHVKINVGGMKCAGCENIIQTNLKELRGVQQVNADYKDASVEVVSDDGSSMEVLQKVKELGYEVDI